MITEVKIALLTDVKFNGHDIRCIKLKFNINEESRPDFVIKPHSKLGPLYSKKFVDWIVGQVTDDEDFMDKCREEFRLNRNRY